MASSSRSLGGERIVTFREPVTLTTAAAVTGEDRDALRSLVRNHPTLKAKACDVQTRALLYELWEIEAALRARRPYRRRVAPVTRR